MIIFGGMNDEKDYNDIAILQTRAAAKQLPPVMSGTLLSNFKPSNTKVFYSIFLGTKGMLLYFGLHFMVWKCHYRQ